MTLEVNQVKATARVCQSRPVSLTCRVPIPKIDRRIAIAKQESQQDLVKVPVLKLAEAEDNSITLDHVRIKVLCQPALFIITVVATSGVVQ
jgi:hypothetical protein